jgi:glycosyltransferase involved in cell wall biosynthesis
MIAGQQSISVCMPNYNHGRYLPSAVSAILSQSRPPDELIIVDDGSTDDSMAILEQLADADRRIKVIKNAQNVGCCRSTNRAINAAKGDFIFLTAADDIVLPGYFEKAFAALQLYPSAGVCVAQVKYLDKDGNDVTPKPSFFRSLLKVGSKQKQPSFFDTAAVLVKLRQDSWFLHGGPTPFFRREVILNVGGLHDDLGPYTDWFNVHYAALKYGVVSLPEQLLAFRQLPGSFGEGTARNSIRAIEKLSRVLDYMRSESYRGVFPADFVERKEVDFAYYALVGSLTYSHRDLQHGIEHLIPAATLLDRILLSCLTLLYKGNKAFAYLYCHRSGREFRWPNSGSGK